MRDVPKTEVAAYIHASGLVPVLALAASTGEPYSPAAVALLDAIMNPSITAIDLDDPQYQAGVAALVGYGVISQSHADAIEAMYVAPPVWTFVAWGATRQARPGWEYHMATITDGTATRGIEIKLPVGSDRDAAMVKFLEVTND